jgi:hypothetical protein
MASVATIASMVGMVVQELELVVQPIAGMAHLAPATVTQIQTAMDGLQGAAAALSQAETTSAATALLPRITTDAEAVLQIAAALPLPPQAAMAFRVASMVLPMVTGLAGMLMAQAKPAPVAAVASQSAA